MHSCEKLEISIGALLLIKLNTLFHQFFSNVLFFVLGSHLGHHVTFSHNVFLPSLLWHVTAFQTFLFLDDFDCFQSTSQVFYRISLNLDFLNFFSRLDRGHGFGGGRQRGIVPFSLHHIKVTYYQHNSSC